MTDDELATDDIIYSPGVKVFKSDTDFPEILPENEWFDVDIITCAAPNIYVGWNEKINISDEVLFKIHEKRLRKIIDVTVLNMADVIILGAFGCGAFGNPPQVVASAANKVLKDYRFAFKSIEFAIYCSKSKTDNFDIILMFLIKLYQNYLFYNRPSAYLQNLIPREVFSNLYVFVRHGKNWKFYTEQSIVCKFTFVKTKFSIR